MSLPGLCRYSIPKKFYFSLDCNLFSKVGRDVVLFKHIGAGHSPVLTPGGSNKRLQGRRTRYRVKAAMRSIKLIGSMSPWVLPERTLGTFRYTGPYPGNYLICRTVPSLLQTVPSFQPPRPTVGRKRTALRHYSLGLFPVQCTHA